VAGEQLRAERGKIVAASPRHVAGSVCVAELPVGFFLIGVVNQPLCCSLSRHSDPAAISMDAND